jgi:hypothetical protein
MRIQITRQECRWLSDLVCKAKIEASLANTDTPHPLLELRRDNMADLEAALNTAIEQDMERERKSAR